MRKPIILVVDDDQIQLEGFGVILGREGYGVYKAKDAHEGLEFLDYRTPNLILLDMMIPAPSRDGWYFLSQLRMKPAAASVPIVIITAIGNSSQVWAVSLGAKGLLRKPINVETLVAEVKRYLKP
jgi:DNA-binding response OmpR family regulator